MKAATVIGLGQMGSTLARLLLRSGHHVTVWNRTPSRAATLVAEGAVLAPSVAAAVAASPVVVVCVLDAAATRDILGSREVEAALGGRTLVQLSTGSPEEARAGEAWAREHGAEYLIGAIQAAPDQMGTPDTPILVSGAEATFRRHEPLLRSFGGGVTYLGEAAGAASAMDLATLSYIYGSMLGFLHGARVAESEGFGVDTYGKLVAGIGPSFALFLEHQARVIQSDNYAVSQSPLKISVEATERIAQAARAAGINAEFPRFAADLFRRGAAAGYAEEEAAALIKVLRASA